MKITVAVECTPEEARDFLGLPDVKPMQESLMSDLENNMRLGIQALNPENMMKAWLPTGMGGADQVQKLFWSQMQQAFSRFTDPKNVFLTITDKKSDAA
jgi:hypothetical protein